MNPMYSHREQFRTLAMWLESQRLDLDAQNLTELVDVAEGLLQRAESGSYTDRTELMERARKLLR